MPRTSRVLKLTQLTLTGFCLLLVGVVVFRDFIFGDKVLLYTDIGDDSTNSYYPYLLLFSRYLRTNGLPMWSFNVGMGQNIFSGIGDLLFNPAIWFPIQTIAQLLVYQHLLHVLVAGLFFYGFLSLRGANFCASLLGSLLFSFSAFMCMGSCWLMFGNEVICIAFVLFAAELMLRQGRWACLSIAVALFSLLTAFHIYLSAVLLAGYVLARAKTPARAVTQCAAIGLLGLGLGTVIWLDSIQAIFSSPRGLGAESSFHTLLVSGPFHFESSLHYFTVILRTFSNDILGTGDNFRGWSNYLEAPSAYAGLLPLLLLPQAFVNATKWRRLVYSVLLSSIILTAVFPWFRYLFWLFQGDYYRTLSFFSITAVIVLSMAAFTRYFEKDVLNVWLLLGTFAFLTGLLYLPLPAMQKLVDPTIQRIVALSLLTYSAFLLLGKLTKKTPLFSWLAVTLSVVEVTYFSWRTVAVAPTVTKQELHERVGYNDYTIDALRDIKAGDHDFYRISKLYSSGPAEHLSLNDAVVFDFYGTASYHSFNNANYIRFLRGTEALSVRSSEAESRWSTGSLSYPLLSTFLCEKYLLANQPLPRQGTSYEETNSYHDVRVYRNNLFLPLGLFLADTVDEKTFSELSAPAKHSLLLQAVVLDKTGSSLSLDEVLGRTESANIADLIVNRRRTAFRMDKFTQNEIEGSIACLTNGFLVFQMPFDAGWRASVDGQRVSPRRLDIGLIGVPLTTGEHTVQLRYLPPLFTIGLIISGISALIFLIALYRWPRLQNKAG